MEHNQRCMNPLGYSLISHVLLFSKIEPEVFANHSVLKILARPIQMLSIDLRMGAFRKGGETFHPFKNKLKPAQKF